jgi:lysophospholipase L1-like esterase
MTLLLASLGLAGSAAAQTRMMPLGNSITEGTGSSHNGGYRHDLYYALQNANVAFDFVGSLQYGTGFPDIDHEGHSGILADQLTAQTYLANNPADVVFLEAGTNDISFGESATTVYNDLERIVDDIHSANAAIAIFLSTVIPRKDSNARQQVTDDLNALIPGLVSAKAAAGYKIFLVDNAGRIKADPNWQTNLMSDNLHPNDAGYSLMADEWFNAYMAYSQPGGILFADHFDGGVLDANKWLRGSNAGNQSAVVGNALELRSSGLESGWVITRNGYKAENTAATVKVIQPNDDGDIGMSPTYTLSSIYGIYDQPNWYRFYTYRNVSSGPYRLYVAWKKNGAEDGLDVTGNLTINGTVYLRLRCDDTRIHFEASLDGVTWMVTYNETFALPGYTLASAFYYELAAYRTASHGVLVVDDFAIEAAPSGADIIPPQITAVAATNLTNSSAQINWQTDEPADSQVEYGLDTNYGSLSSLNPVLVTTHVMTLSGLQENTTYHYRVHSKDAAGNPAMSSDFTFTTTSPSNVIFADDFNVGGLDANKWRSGANAGNQAAVINNALELRSNGFESGWVITRNAYAARNTIVSVKVQTPNDDGNLGISPTYSLASPYGIYDQANWYRFYTYRNGHSGAYRLYVAWNKNGAGNGLDVTGNLVINGALYLRLRFDNSNVHFEASLDGVAWTEAYNEPFALPGYTLDTPFYYELAAYKTGSNGVLNVDDFSIIPDNPVPDTQPPEISGVAAQNINGSGAQIVWQTNEAADSQVEYGLTTSYGALSPLDPALVSAHAVTLSGLQANTTYHYRVRSQDAAGNLAASGDYTFTTPPPSSTLFADDFNAGSLDANKWQKGTIASNQASVVNNALELRSSGAVSGWVVTRNAFAARNTTVAVKVVRPNDDGSLGVSPTYNLASQYGIYDQTNWYRFYTYRNGHTGAYRLYVQWKKNGVENGFDVTGSLVINGAVYLRLRFDDSNIHFEASLDGMAWADAYNEAFDLPGYTLDTPFYYELAGYNTTSNGVLTVDDFAISSGAVSNFTVRQSAPESATLLLPTAFALQNYPNPFNAATRIRFGLPREAEIHLAVFDLLGREVQELLAASKPLGTYEVIWDGKNREGVTLSTGTYLIRLRYRLAGSGAWSQVVRRVMMVK